MQPDSVDQHCNEPEQHDMPVQAGYISGYRGRHNQPDNAQEAADKRVKQPHDYEEAVAFVHQGTCSNEYGGARLCSASLQSKTNLAYIS